MQPLVDLRHSHTRCGTIEPGHVLIDAEQIDFSIRPLIGLGAFKHVLTAMQYLGCGIKRKRVIGCYRGVMPAIFRGIVLNEHAVREIAAESENIRKMRRTRIYQGLDANVHTAMMRGICGSPAGKLKYRGGSDCRLLFFRPRG